MSGLLYLDTARLGLMIKGAQRAHRDFARLAGEVGCTLYFEQFLRAGNRSLPKSLQRRYPGLESWKGPFALKNSLRRVVSASTNLPLLLANRSAQLMKFAARLLFHPCESVLVTDLGWPTYHSVLEAERARSHRRVTNVAIREAILREHASIEQIINLICEEFSRNQCDGLFITEVSHDGIRLPVEQIVRVIRSRSQLRFVVVDGAQAFCHVPTHLQAEYCDFYLAGCHKWLRAFQPMGIGFFGWRRSKAFIEQTLEQMIRCGDLDDPLLRFSRQIETDSLDSHTETVSIAPLFSSQGAIADTATDEHERRRIFNNRLANAETLADLAAKNGWRPVVAQPNFRSGILLLQSKSAIIRQSETNQLREAFQRRGIAVSAYENGVIRLSMPDRCWRAYEVTRLRNALREAG